MDVMPKWAEVVLVPLISLFLAAIISALVILGIGEDPVEAVNLMVTGALGSTYGWGYTLYYATNFMFTGLAVAMGAKLWFLDRMVWLFDDMARTNDEYKSWLT